MTTNVFPRGRAHKLRAAYESTFATNPGANFSELNVYSAAFQRVRPLVDDDVLGAGLANTIDARPAAPNTEDATGKLSVPFDMAQIGWWLGAALGRVSATGTTPKSHAFTSGNTSIPTLAIERELVAAAQYEALLGAAVKSMKFPLGPAAGYHEIAIDLMGAKVLEPFTSTSAGTPTVEALANRVPKTVGILKVGGSQVGKILSGDMTINNELDSDRYVGDSAWVSAMALLGQSVDFNLQARYDTDALRAYGALGANLIPASVAVDIVYTLTANLQLTLSAGVVRFEPVDVETTNGKTMTVNLKGRAEGSSGAAMLTATLLNAHATY